MPADLRTTDDRLRAAYADLAASVRPDDPLRILPPFSQEVGDGGRIPHVARGRRRWLVAVAAGVAVLAVVAAATLIPRALRSGPPVVPALPRGMAYVVTIAPTPPDIHFSGIKPEIIPVNLASHKALAPIRLGVTGSPLGAAITPDGRTIYVLADGGRVIPFNVARGKALRPIQVGGVPEHMILSPNGRTGYVIEPHAGVAVINLVQNSYAGFIRIPHAGSFVLTPNGRTLYVASDNGSAVTPVSTADNRAGRSIATSANVSCTWVCASIAVTPDASTVYVTGDFRPPGNGSAQTAVITPISTATNTAAAQIKLIGVTGPQLTSVTIAPDGRSAYVGTTAGIVRVNLAAAVAGPALRMPAAYPGYGVFVSADSATVLAISPANATLYRFAAPSGRRLPSVRLASTRWAALSGVLSADGKTVYAFGLPTHLQLEGTPPGVLIPVSAATGKVGRFIGLPAAARYMVFGP